MPAMCVTYFTSKFEETAMNLALPQIQKDFNLSAQNAQWLSTTFFIAAAAFAIPLGKLSDSFGLINTFIISLLLLTFLRLACFFTTNFPLLLVLRFIIGALAAGTVTFRNAMTTRYPRIEEQSKTIGIIMILNQISAIIIPLISGVIQQEIGWKYQFILMSILSFISLLMLIPFENPKPIQKNSKVDIFGSLYLTLTISFFCLIFTLLSNKHYIFAGVSILFSFLFGIFFIFVEQKHSNPVLPLYIMKNPVSDLFIQNQKGTANAWLLPQLLDNVTISGIVSAVGAILTLISAIITPIITKKVVNRYVLYYGYIFSTICIILQIVCALNSIAFIVFYILIGFFGASIMQTIFPMTLLSVSSKYSSCVSAFPTTSRTIGNSMSLSIVSSLTMFIRDILLKRNISEKASLIRGAQVSLLLVVFLSIFCFINTIFRIGNSSKESGKIGFKNSMIRELKEENEQLLEQSTLSNDQVEQMSIK
ncbi:Major_facilitator superfamily protein [Hexamita inflata]|uniref:Major facilitator superfamily protein n=1 Tax=Hexamita inflata TaxID=28002 RepID=A0AA86RM34_9EUKA|nr:Major facilitator superfamily protein [Hexamita inflata]